MIFYKSSFFVSGADLCYKVHVCLFFWYHLRISASIQRIYPD